MSSKRHYFLVASALAGGLSACGSKDKAAEQTSQAASPAATNAPPAAPETAPAVPAASTATQPAATFDLSTVPVSSAELGPFPYLAGLPGYHISEPNNDSFDFERSYIYDGKNIIAVEGKVSRRLFVPNDRGKKSSDLMIQRNYEELFRKIGAVKVSDSPVPREAADKIGGNDEYYKHAGGVGGSNEPTYTYVIRQKDKEVWLQMQIGDGEFRLNATERAPMAQQATLLKADELKKN